MKRLYVTVLCSAYYTSSIDVPDEMTFEDAIKYAKKHINEIPRGELEYVPDGDVLDEENCELQDINIRSIAYNLYKKEWINTHLTTEEKSNTLEKYKVYLAQCDVTNVEKMQTYSKWLYDNGYCHGMHACYDEFIDNEYRDDNYMKALLDDNDLIDLYNKDIIHNVD